MELITRSFTLKQFSIDSERPGFTGVACPYGETDTYGDVLRPGVFKKSIADSGGKLPLLWSHQMNEPIGSVSVESDSTRSLNVRGTLLVETVARAKEVYSLLQEGVVKGISVGFVVIRSAPLDAGGREFSEGKLVEISLTPAAAFDSARVRQVHSLVTGNEHAAILKALATFDPAKWSRLGTPPR